MPCEAQCCVKSELSGEWTTVMQDVQRGEYIAPHGLLLQHPESRTFITHCTAGPHTHLNGKEHLPCGDRRIAFRWRRIVQTFLVLLVASQSSRSEEAAYQDHSPCVALRFKFTSARITRESKTSFWSVYRCSACSRCRQSLMAACNRGNAETFGCVMHVFVLVPRPSTSFNFQNPRP